MPHQLMQPTAAAALAPVAWLNTARNARLCERGHVGLELRARVDRVGRARLEALQLTPPRQLRLLQAQAPRGLGLCGGETGRGRGFRR